MKMKKLLLVVLALAILTSLSAGTLAVYTKTVNDTEKIEAKRFGFNADGKINSTTATSINLAPQESMEYDFYIENSEVKGGAVAEVPIKFDVTIDYASAFSAMPGLTAILYNNGNKVGTYNNGVITYTTSSEENERFNQNYKVVLTWNDDGDSNVGHTAAGTNKVNFTNGLYLTVVGTQIVPTTPAGA